MQRPKKRLSLLLAFALGLVPNLLAQETPKSNLSRAKRTFGVADQNSNGRLEASELSRASISGQALRAWDEDGNGSFSEDEFLMFYRHLLKNSGQVPGSELDQEAKRIEQARAAAKKKRAEQARKQGAGQSTDQKAKSKGTADDKGTEVVSQPSQGAGVAGKLPVKPTPIQSSSTGSATGTSTVEKYRRAQAALNERIKKSGENAGLGSSATQKLVSRARGLSTSESKQLPSAKPGSTGVAQGRGESLRERLARARVALGDRAKGGGSSRELYERASSSLQDRALNASQAGKDSRSSSVLEGPGREKDGALVRASSTGSSEGVQHSQDSLTKRAKDALGRSYSIELSEADSEGLNATVRDELGRSLGALRTRARAAGWSTEQFVVEKRRLIKRAKDAQSDRPKTPPAGSGEGGAKTAPEGAGAKPAEGTPDNSKGGEATPPVKDGDKPKGTGSEPGKAEPSKTSRPADSKKTDGGKATKKDSKSGGKQTPSSRDSQRKSPNRATDSADG